MWLKKLNLALYKVAVLKPFAKFSRKHLWWSHFLVKHHVSASKKRYLEKGTVAGVLLWILEKKFKIAFFLRNTFSRLFTHLVRGNYSKFNRQSCFLYSKNQVGWSILSENLENQQIFKNSCYRLEKGEHRRLKVSTYEFIWTKFDLILKSYRINLSTTLYMFLKSLTIGQWNYILKVIFTQKGHNTFEAISRCFNLPKYKQTKSIVFTKIFIL